MNETKHGRLKTPVISIIGSSRVNKSCIGMSGVGKSFFEISLLVKKPLSSISINEIYDFLIKHNYTQLQINQILKARETTNLTLAHFPADMTVEDMRKKRLENIIDEEDEFASNLKKMGGIPIKLEDSSSSAINLLDLENKIITDKKGEIIKGEMVNQLSKL